MCDCTKYEKLFIGLGVEGYLMAQLSRQCYRMHKLVESSYVWKLKFIKKLLKIRHLKKEKMIGGDN